MSIDIRSLWDFGRPEVSEKRFLAALEGASEDDALILRTQIARTHGLRGDFAGAQATLREIAPGIEAASPEARARFELELGRTYASAAHSPEARTPAARELARACYGRALEIAEKAQLDYLAIDALHMMTVVDPAPEQQLEWNRQAITYMLASEQPEAKLWEGSLLNNTGYALHLLGRYDEALDQFKLALAAREREGDASKIRIAWWMIAWTLRSLRHLDEALQIQLRLEGECEQAGEPDPYVFEELEHLYTALGESEKAAKYAARRKAG